ncbi:alpha/beta fold hydrolase [Mycobacterium colombiense]|uniref:alpha/beta fold hydrolase n=1 Tax=Mycobacterium colombiense TaxID=339268 RepID=UPI0009E447DE
MTSTAAELHVGSHFPGRALGRTRTVIARDGVSLSVRDHGSSCAPKHTVILLHGFCLDQSSWDIQIDQLTRELGNDIRIISYDHRGHGDSSAAPMHAYRIEQLADDLAALLVALGVSGPLTLAGHSMGGMTALAYLARSASYRPVEPQSLVLIASAAGKLAKRGLGRLLATPTVNILYAMVQHAPLPMTDKTIRALSGPACAALTRRCGYGLNGCDARAAVAAGTINATPLRTKVGFLPSLRSYDQYHTLSAISAATTVVSGGADVFTPPAHAHDMVAAIPGATLMHQPDAGHMLLQEAPQLVTEAISRAVAQSDGSAATSSHSPRSGARRSHHGSSQGRGSVGLPTVSPARQHRGW